MIFIDVDKLCICIRTCNIYGHISDLLEMFDTGTTET